MCDVAVLRWLALERRNFSVVVLVGAKSQFCGVVVARLGEKAVFESPLLVGAKPQLFYEKEMHLMR